jgi:hypothetical protein
MIGQEFVPFGATVGGDTGLPSLDSPYQFDSVDQFRQALNDEFKKAVTAGYGTDVATLTGGGSLRLQSIEPTLLRTIQEDEHFVFFNKLVQTPAGATVDEFTIKTAIGGYPGSGFNSEMGDIAETQGTYERKVGLVKYLMTKRQVSVVQQSQRTLVDTMAEEKIDAARELKTSVEWACFYGNAAVNPLEFDGLRTVIEATNDPDLIQDARGAGLSFVAQEIIELAASIASMGRFGRATDLFTSFAVQSSELDQKLDPAFRVPIGSVGEGGLRIGTPVAGIKTSHGVIKTNQDVFIQEGQMPFVARPGPYAGVTTGTGAPVAPTTVAGAAAQDVANSKFVTANAGNYFYAVESISKAGRSGITKSAQIAVVAGDKVTVTITHATDNVNPVTGFVIYRSRKNGTNADNDFREVIRVPRAAGATTVYVDFNQNIPGTSCAFLVNMQPGANAVTLRRLLPMTLFPLYPTTTASKPWAQLFFCYLRIAKPRHIAMVKNILPASAAWIP